MSSQEEDEVRRLEVRQGPSLRDRSRRAAQSFRPRPGSEGSGCARSNLGILAHLTRPVRMVPTDFPGREHRVGLPAVLLGHPEDPSQDQTDP
jgi:hypothetical protein